VVNVAIGTPARSSQRYHCLLLIRTSSYASSYDVLSLSRTPAGNVGKSATTTYTAPDEHDTFEPPTAAALLGRTMAGGCEDKSCQHCDEVSETVRVRVLGLSCAYTCMCYRYAYFTGPHVSASLVIHANTAWRLLSCGSGCVAVWLSVLFPLLPTAAVRA
jgi:hypothetical protein